MNKNFKEKQKQFAEKYKVNIGGISRANNVDMGVALDMFISNVKQVVSEEITEFYKGAGLVKYDEAIKDIIELDKARR